MDQLQRYAINQPSVIAEVVDREAIIVNLESGVYYSLLDSACSIWSLLSQHYTMSEAVAALASEYVGAADDIESGVEALLVELLAEQLLIPAKGEVTAQIIPEPNSAVSDNHSRPLFRRPVLEKYTDMADLLLLDPIHDVDEIGWPHPAPDKKH